MADPITKTITIINDNEDEWTDPQEDILLSTKEDIEALSNPNYTYIVNIIPRPKKLPV